MITVEKLDSPSNKPTLWAVSEYYAPNFSGAAIQAHRILSRLAKQGYTVHVLTTADQAARSLAGQTRCEQEVQIHYLPVTRRRGWEMLASLPPLHRWIRAANDYVRDHSFHRQIRRTLQSHARAGDILQWYIVGDSTWSVIRLAEQNRWRNVIQISLVGADDPGSFRASLLGISTARKRKCFDRADRIIGLSRALTDSCLHSGIAPERVLRIPNGVELGRYREPNRTKTQWREQIGLDPHRRYLAFVGSAIHRKGIDVAIPAFIQVAAAVSDLDLLVIGPCDFRDTTRHDPSRQLLIDQLRSQLRHNDCDQRVHWVGQVDNVPDYLRAADIFFFPTRREGLPNAMAEAMASGLPVVASELQGITTDLVDDNVEGKLISGHVAEDYARALIDLSSDTPACERMGTAARRRIEREFDLDKVVPQYAQLYESLDHTAFPES